MKNKVILLLKILCIGYIACVALLPIFGDKEYELKIYPAEDFSTYYDEVDDIPKDIVFAKKNIVGIGKYGFTKEITITEPMILQCFASAETNHRLTYMGVFSDKLLTKCIVVDKFCEKSEGDYGAEITTTLESGTYYVAFYSINPAKLNLRNEIFECFGYYYPVGAKTNLSFLKD